MFFESTRKKRQETEVDNFKPTFFFELNPTDEQLAICKGNENCLFDLIVTNDTQFAERTLKSEEEANTTVDLLGMSTRLFQEFMHSTILFTRNC